MKEITRSQIDAVARSPKCLIFFECKFTEPDGGPCSQTQPLRKGPHKGTIQCNGNYEPQYNRVTGTKAWCPLTGKGIRYWEFVPKVFDVRSDMVITPCPFCGPWFQWMRNLTCCWLIAQDEK